MCQIHRTAAASHGWQASCWPLTLLQGPCRSLATPPQVSWPASSRLPWVHVRQLCQWPCDREYSAWGHSLHDMLTCCCAAANGGVAAPAQLREAVTSALSILKQGGLIDDFRIVWGATPNLPARPYGEPNYPQAAELESTADSGGAAGDDGASLSDSLAVFQVCISRRV
jgi:hypothetical protein